MQIDKIYLGDCLEIMKDIDDKSIDMILCDLPYGTTQCKWDSIISFDRLWEHYSRIAKGNCPILLFGSEPFSSNLRLSNIKRFKYDYIWIKSRPNGFLNAKKMPMKKHEIISVFSFGTCNYYPRDLIKKDKQNKNTGIENVYGKVNKNWKQEITYTNYPVSVLNYNNVTRSIHPTQKPIDLCEYLIKTYTNEGDLVLDNCMGSGTTAIAAINTKRHYIGIEQNKDYYDIASKRIDENIGKGL